MSAEGNQPVFLVSQPRAGSTLVQRTLATHPQIHTTSEPWIMLHPLRALEDGAFKAQHDAWTAHVGLTDYVNELPDGVHTYYEAVRLFGQHMYDAVLKGTGASIFLDKTPRYYMILGELAQVFPESKFILLVRNPAAVLSSIYHSWVYPNLWKIRKYGLDLLDAPSSILAARADLGTRAFYVRYEDYLADPAVTKKRMLDFLDLPNMDDSASKELPRFRLGDQGNVYDRRDPEAHFADRWKSAMSDPQLWRWTSDYMSMLGEATVDGLGYDPESIRRCLAASKRIGRVATIPLRTILRGSTYR